MAAVDMFGFSVWRPARAPFDRGLPRRSDAVLGPDAGFDLRGCACEAGFWPSRRDWMAAGLTQPSGPASVGDVGLAVPSEALITLVAVMASVCRYERRAGPLAEPARAIGARDLAGDAPA